jgi:hypothetical protein
MGRTVTTAAQTTDQFVAKNEAPVPAGDVQAAGTAQVPAAASQPSAQAAAAPPLKGYVMEAREQAQPSPSRAGRSAALTGAWAALYATLPILALLIAWRLRHRRRD